MMPRLPSIDTLASAARTSFLRYPETVIAGLVSATVGILLVGADTSAKWHPFVLVAVLALGIPLTFTVAVIMDSRVAGDARIARWRPIGMLLVVATLAVLYASAWFQAQAAFATRFAVFAVSAHLAVAFLPYLSRGGEDAFWDYNQEMFERFAVAVVYSIVLFCGLAAAMGTAQVLFKWKLGFDSYARLWLGVVFAFNTWFFVGGLRAPLAPVAPGGAYPAGLRIFTQYLLLPLVTLYVAILYAYMIQILVHREWPRGTVGWMVSGLSAAGMLAFLLVHPLRDRNENRWVRIYSRRFFASLLPLIGLLLLAAWRRIREYGITEPRYLLVVLGLWIGGISIYFLASRARDIRVIPASLCALLLVTTFGPWGAASVSARDQIDRLSRALERLDILRDGRMHAAPETVSIADRRMLSGTLDYLNRMHPSTLRRWFEPKAPEAWNGSSNPQDVLASVGLRHVGSFDRQGETRFTLMSKVDQEDSANAIAIADYDALARITLGDWMGDHDDSIWVRLPDRNVVIRLQNDGRSLQVSDGLEVLAIPIQELVAAARRRSQETQVPASEMFTSASGFHLDAAFAFESISGWEITPTASDSAPAPRVDLLTATVLIRAR